MLTPTNQLSGFANPVHVYIGGGAAELLYAGAAPGMVAGVAQANVRVPPDALRDCPEIK